MSFFKPKHGQYYYAPHRSLWGVWRHEVISDVDTSGTFVNDYVTREEAAEAVRKLNHWK